MTDPSHAWVREFPAEITVCGPDGLLLEMNSAAEKLFAADGGRNLLGTNMLDCHTEPDRGKLKDMLATHRSNAYVNEENGKRTFFFQAPWYRAGRYAGFVELSFDLPTEIPHFIRE